MKVVVLALFGEGFIGGLGNLGDSQAKVGRVASQSTDTQLQCFAKELSWVPVNFFGTVFGHGLSLGRKSIQTYRSL